MYIPSFKRDIPVSVLFQNDPHGEFWSDDFWKTAERQIDCLNLFNERDEHVQSLMGEKVGFIELDENEPNDVDLNIKVG